MSHPEYNPLVAAGPAPSGTPSDGAGSSDEQGEVGDAPIDLSEVTAAYSVKARRARESQGRTRTVSDQTALERVVELLSRDFG